MFLVPVMVKEFTLLLFIGMILSNGLTIGQDGGEFDMQCPECGGEFVKKVIIHSERHETVLYIFENTPAWVCSQCGAEYLESEVTKKIDYLIENHVEPEKYEKVPVYSLV